MKQKTWKITKLGKEILDYCDKMHPMIEYEIKQDSTLSQFAQITGGKPCNCKRCKDYEKRIEETKVKLL